MCCSVKSIIQDSESISFPPAGMHVTLCPPQVPLTFCHPVHKTNSTQKTQIKPKYFKDISKFKLTTLVFHVFEEKSEVLTSHS